MYYIGIDVGGMSIKGGIVDEKGKIYAKSSIVTNDSQPSEDNVRDIAALCAGIIKEAGLDDKDISGMGMGVPGSVDSKTGIINYTCNILFREYDFAGEFKKYYSFPVVIGNDADCAVLGETTFGEYKNIKNALLVTLGTGVGTGMLIEGRLMSGFHGAGGEGGHTVIRVGGVKCNCGRRGCWEVYASATALIRQTNEAIEKHPESMLRAVAAEEGKVSGKTAFTAAKRGDKTAISVVNKYLKYVGEGLVNLGNLIRPEVIFIGGGISNEGDYVIDRLQRYVTKYSYGGSRNPQIAVKKATLKNDAGILGASALCLNR